MGFKNKLQYKIILLVFGMLLLVGEMTQSLSDKSPAVDGTLLSQLLSTAGHACSTPKDHIVGRACLMLIVVEQGCRRTPRTWHSWQSGPETVRCDTNL